MSSNEKIKIMEVDNTKPLSPLTSSDIAFVVGFATEDTAPKNIPTLCTSVSEFEKFFGKDPYTLTDADVANYSDYGVKAGADRGFLFAKTLVEDGMSVIFSNLSPVTKLEEGESVSMLSAIYGLDEAFQQQLELLEDRNEFSVKYITSGGYPAIIPYTEDTKKSAVDKLAGLMIKCAEKRGDAVALIDYPMEQEEQLFSLEDDSVYSKLATVVNTLDADKSYGTIMYPWGEYALTTGTVNMPASFGYLRCVAAATKSGPNWLAMAGVNRGVVPGLNKLLVKNELVRNKDAEEMQPEVGTDKQKYCINCITRIRPYGFTLWGNRTLKAVNDKGLVATNFLNIRNMVSDIKKVVYTSAKFIMFEQNTDVTWLKFKSKMSPLLDQMKQGFAISDYKILKLNTRYDGTRLGRGELVAVIRIYPIDSIEYFELTVEINDKDVAIS